MKGWSLLLVPALIVCLSCRDRAEDDARVELPNVLFIMIDTLRADRSTPYGYRFDTTPFLAELAQRGVLVQTAYAPMPATGPSTATVFTSLEPRSHGVLKNGMRLADHHLTIAEIFHDAGYQTAGFVSSTPLKARGLAQGFEYFLDSWAADEEAKPPAYGGRVIKPSPARRGSYTTSDALSWFANDRDPSSKFFAFVHYHDPHEPYARPERELEPFATGRAEGEINPALSTGYDAEVAYTDRELRRLLAGLEAGGHLDNTLIVLWADHGQGLHDHGWPGHGPQLYDEAMHVPLIFVWPGRIPADRVFDAPVELVDLLPTVLGLLELERPDAPFEGRNLTRPLVGSAPPDSAHPMYFQRQPSKRESTILGTLRKGPMWAVQAGGWKYIEAVQENRFELYDLNTDPGERDNVYAERPAVASDLKRQLDAWVHGREFGPPADLDDIPSDQRRELEALGYID